MKNHKVKKLRHLSHDSNLWRYIYIFIITILQYTTEISNSHIYQHFVFPELQTKFNIRN